MTNYIYYNQELYHYGIPGMKWGIRRYQNYDGSYIKAGLKRYNSSKEIYEKKREEYKRIKNNKNASRYEKRYAKSKMKEAKRKMNKDYKHLALDKKADEGKILYSEGKRITQNARTTYMIGRLGVYASAGAELAKQYGYIDTKTARIIEATAVGATITSKVKDILDEIPNNKLRAYYSHTSNY